MAPKEHSRYDFQPHHRPKQTGKSPAIKKRMTNKINRLCITQGQNALHLAAMHGRFDCVKYMLDHCGIDVNEQSSEARSTALHYCVSESSGASCIQCLKILLERGAKHSMYVKENFDVLVTCTFSSSNII